MHANETNLFKDEGYLLMGAAFEVYNESGPGFLEEVYQQALSAEFSFRKIEFTAKPRLTIVYKGLPLDKYYEADFLVSEGIIVEIKAVKSLAAEHEAQLLNELKAGHYRVGYLINFGALNSLEWKRMVDSSQNISGN